MPRVAPIRGRHKVASIPSVAIQEDDEETALHTSLAHSDQNADSQDCREEKEGCRTAPLALRIVKMKINTFLE
mgnify:FL=1